MYFFRWFVLLTLGLCACDDIRANKLTVERGTADADAGPSDASAGPVTVGDLMINTNGQPQLFSTFTPGGDSAGQNIWVGGGGQQATSIPLNPAAGAGNAAFGWQALLAMTTGNDNTAVGAAALRDNTTGGDNTALGRSALQSNVKAHQNTALGVNALAFVDDPTEEQYGWWNTAVGVNSLLQTTSGWNNTAVGMQSGGSNTTGDSNVYLGVNAATAGTCARANVAVGTNSLRDIETGDNNVVIGTNAGLGIQTGRANTIIGANLAGLAAGLSNAVILADGDGDPRIVSSSTGATYVKSSIGIGGPSGPRWTSGAGVPLAGCAVGDLYSNTTGSTNTTLYVCTAPDTWTAK